jgi:hypothetical protein
VTTQKTAEQPDTDREQLPDSQPVGRIDTTGTKPSWEIDQKFYEMRQIGDFGIAAQQRLNRDGREFYALWTADEELTDDQGKRLKLLLERMFHGDKDVPALLDAPKTVLRKLNDGDKADVVLSFTLAPLRKAMAAAQAQTEVEKDQVEAPESPSISTS